MADKRTREHVSVDYRSLAGFKTSKMASKDEGDKKSVKSGKSAKSTRSKKSKQKEDLQQEADQLDKELEHMEKQLDNDPAYLSVLEDQVRKKFGDEFVTETPIRLDDLKDDKKFEEFENIHKTELDMMDDRLVGLQRRKQIMLHCDKLAERRVEIERLMAEQKLMEQQCFLRGQEALFEVRLREKRQDDKEREFQEKCSRLLRQSGADRTAGLTSAALIPGEEEAEEEVVKTRTEEWVKQADHLGGMNPDRDLGSLPVNPRVRQVDKSE